MKLFWGLIDTTPKHQHTFEPSLWKPVFLLNISRQGMFGETHPAGAVQYYQNSCLTCGELIEHAFERV